MLSLMFCSLLIDLICSPGKACLLIVAFMNTKPPSQALTPRPGPSTPSPRLSPRRSRPSRSGSGERCALAVPLRLRPPPALSSRGRRSTLTKWSIARSPALFREDVEQDGEGGGSESGRSIAWRTGFRRRRPCGGRGACRRGRCVVSPSAGHRRRPLVHHVACTCWASSRAVLFEPPKRLLIVACIDALIFPAGMIIYINSLFSEQHLGRLARVVVRFLPVMSSTLGVDGVHSSVIAATSSKCRSMRDCRLLAQAHFDAVRHYGA